MTDSPCEKHTDHYDLCLVCEWQNALDRIAALERVVDGARQVNRNLTNALALLDKTV